KKTACGAIHRPSESSYWHSSGAGTRQHPPRHSSLACDEVIHLTLGIGLGLAVFLLDQTHHLIALALDAVKLVIGEVAPGLFGFALEFFPLSFDLIAVHGALLCMIC